MELKTYYGKQIFCGTYAVLNALEENINPELFELTAGVPFGIRCVDMANERLWTPFRDPNIGIDYAVENWKIPCRKFSSESKDKAFSNLIKSLLIKNAKIVLGPINMGKLLYIPLCNLYDGVDHYICLQQCSNGICITDSEGFTLLPTSPEELYKMWNINRVYEARGQYTYRCFTKCKESLPPNIPTDYIRYRMHTNMMDAERSGQGCQAIMNAYQILKENSYSKWKLCFLYELEYMVQRKMLVYNFMKDLLGEPPGVLDLIITQIEIAIKIYQDIKERHVPDPGKFERFAEIESALSRLYS